VSRVVGLQYFTQRVDGRLYGGWYRPAGGIVEIYARGQLRTVALGGRSPEEVAQETLTRMVRGTSMPANQPHHA
jgi:hypothetical protein